MTAIAVGRNHTLALLTDGTVKLWGENANGQLGDNSMTDRTSPVAVSSLTGVIGVGTGATHSLAVKSDGTARSWGDNFYLFLVNTRRPVKSRTYIPLEFGA